MPARSRLVRFACAVLFVTPVASMHLSAQETVRSKAVVNFTFDEEHGPAKDSATVGQFADEGRLSGDPVRTASPFWNQSGKKTIPLDAAKQQFIEIPHSADVNRPDALTLSLLFVNLNHPDDGSPHGLIAKRGQMDGKAVSNYGINFIQQSDLLQVYVNDGSGYKIAQFSTKAAIPVRKMVFVTATYQVADAPGQDADTDTDDVRIQLFSNGEQLKPKAVSGGFVEGNDGWITDVNPAALANTLPLSIGRSDAGGEYTSGVIDEFSLFPHALSPDDVKKLFLEVAGANVRELIAQDATTPSLTPVISSLSQPGIRIGQTTTLTISGNNLATQPRLVLPTSNVAWEIVSAEPNRIVAKLTASGSFVPGIYPLWVATTYGISQPLPVVFDQMVQAPLPTTGAEAPVALPAAYYGTLSGGAQLRAYITGKKGQRIVADVELKRLGGQANPVLEFKSAQGTPLHIGWGHKSLQGDARVTATLPHDGTFAVELHDLTYNAPGQNAFRLKIGDLKLMDATLPAVAAPGVAMVQPIGTGFTAAEQWSAIVSPLPDSRYGLLSFSGTGQVDGGVPLVRVEQSTEILEIAAASGELQTIDATLPGTPPKPVGINGRLSQRGERDRYLLNVTPGQKLRFTLMTQSLASPVEGEITLFQHPEGNVLAVTGDQPTLADQVLEFAVPAERRQIQVGVRDLLNQGGERAFYRLEISPAGQPDFALSVNSAVAVLPENGTAPLELRVNRNGYNGPISLRISGDPSISVTPPQIAEGVSGRTYIRLSRQGPPAAGVPSLVRLVGESTGLQPTIQRSANVSAVVPEPMLAETLGLGTTLGIGISVDVASLSPVLFRGLTTDVPISLKRHAGLAADKPVRFSLTTTEASRLRQPGNPAAGNFPMVSLATANPVEPGVEQTSLKLQVPLEVAEATIDLYVRAEALRHLYADAVLATSYSQPYRIQIQNAVSPKVDEPTLAIVSERDHAVTGQLQRTAGFSGPVEVTLTGLPNEYQVTAASVAGDQGAFNLVVKAPKVEQEQPLANVKLRVTSQGALIAPEQAVNVKVTPAK